MMQSRWVIKATVRKAGWQISDGRKVIMRLWVYWPDNRRRDVHNLHKLLGDAPEGIAYKDDKWLLIQDMDFQVDAKNPRVEVEIIEWWCF